MQFPKQRKSSFNEPLFDKATLTVATNRQFTIVAQDNGPQRPYIHAAKLNETDFNKVYLTHRQITDGGEIKFEMTSGPDYLWAIGEKDRPPALLPLRPAQ